MYDVIIQDANSTYIAFFGEKIHYFSPGAILVRLKYLQKFGDTLFFS